MRQDGLPQVLRALAGGGDPLPQEVVRSLERRSPEEEDQVIAGNWTDPDLRDHPSVVDLAEGSVAGQAWETEPDRPDL